MQQDSVRTDTVLLLSADIFMKGHNAMTNEDKNRSKIDPENTSYESRLPKAPVHGADEYQAGADAQEDQDHQKDRSTLRESQFEYGTSPQNHLYTLEDYYALPDDRRVELIDGVFYDMAAPSWLHQQTCLKDRYRDQITGLVEDLRHADFGR